MPAFNLLQILALYAALLGLVYIALCIPIIRIRREKQISLGAGDDEKLHRRVRAHANFAEYVPLALILIAAAVVTGAHSWFIHACGIVLIAGRLAHAWAIYDGTIKLRVFGMLATFAVIVAASVHTLIGFFA